MMTADEMFQELGYGKKETDFPEIATYAKMDGRAELTITVRHDGYVACRENERNVIMSFAEIKAVAKLLEEMEGEENG